MKSSTSNYLAYSIVLEKDDDSEFSFVTQNGIRYIIYFTEADGFVPSASSFAQDLKMFGFGLDRATWPEGKMPNDPQIGITIFESLYYYMSKYPERILIYVCSDESIWYPGPDKKNIRYAKWRSERFSKWYEEWQQTGVMPTEKIDYGLYGQLYCSCFFRSGNPYETEVKEVIEEVKLEKQP